LFAIHVASVTLDEIENSLPNGLHDAEIQRISVDYAQHTVTIDLSVFVGELDAPPEKREAYREASLLISGLQFAAIEPPDAGYPFSKAESLRVDLCDARKNLGSDLLKALPKGSFCRSIFINEWNAFVHLAGMKAEIHWKAPVVYRNERKHFLPGESVDL